MARKTVTQKTTVARFFAIFIVAAFLVGGFVAMPAGALGVDDSDTIFATVDGVPMTGADLKAGGDPSVVDITILLPADTAAPKVVVQRTTPGSTTATKTTVDLSKVRSVTGAGSTDIWWTARLLLGTSDPKLVGKYIPMDGAKTNTVEVFYPSETAPTHTLLGQKAILWTKANTANFATIGTTTINPLASDTTLSFFAGTMADGTLAPATLQAYVQDKDITPPAAAAFTDNKATCPAVPAYRFLLQDADGNQNTVTPTCIEAVRRGTSTTFSVAYLLRATNVDYTAASIAPGEPFTLSLLDPSADGGIPRLVHAKATLSQATDYSFGLFRDDHRTATTAVTGRDTTYVLRVIDQDSNGNPSSADKLKVTAQMKAGASIIGSTNLELVETGPSTNEFQTAFKLSRNPVSGEVAVPTNVVSGQSYTLQFIAGDARGATAEKPTSQKASSVFPWTPSSDTTIRVLDQDQRLIAATPSATGAALVKFGESANDFPQAATPTGSFLQLRVEDPDASGSELRAVVRGPRADPGTCNAAVLPATGPLPDDTPGCGYLTLTQSGTSSTFVGYFGVFTPTTFPGPLTAGSDPTKAAHKDKARILVSPDTIVTVEVLDPKTGSGSENKPIATQFIWKQAYDGQITVDKDNYYRSETVNVRILDPDQRSATSLSAIARSTSGGQVALALAPVAGQPGLFDATLKLSGSGALATADGDTVTIEYRDPQDANGQDRRAAGQTPFTRMFQVWSTGSGFPVFTQGNLLDDQEGVIRVADANHDPAVYLPQVSLGATYSYPTVSDRVFLDATTTANTFEGKIRPTDWFMTEAVTPLMTTQTIGGTGTEGSCYWRLELAHVPSHFATVVAKKANEDDVVWRHSTAPHLSNDVFRYDAPRKRLVIDENDQTPTSLCSQQSLQRADVVGWTFHVTYVPASFVTERLINGATDLTSLPVQLQAPFFNSEGGLTPAMLPKTDWSRSVIPQVTTADGSWFIPVDLDGNIGNAGERACSATVDGAAGGCTIDPATMIATVTASGGAKVRAGALVEVQYYQNNVASTVLGTDADGNDLPNVVLPNGPVALGSIQTADRMFRFDPAPGAETNPVSTLQTLAANPMPQIERDQLKDANGVTPSGAQTLFYHTEVFGDNRVAYNERFADSEGRITATYDDPSGAVGSPRSATATSSYSINKPADITPKTPDGKRTRFLFGADQGAFLEVTDPAGNADNTAIETIKVSASGRAVKFDGVGAVLEQDSLTLTETGPGTGVFTAPLKFLPTGTNGDGALSVAQNDMVQVDFDYTARDSQARAWYYRSEGGTMSIGSQTVKGEGITTSLELRDREVGERVVDFRFTDMPDPTATNAAGQEINRNLVLNLPPAFVPSVVDSEAVYVCKGLSNDCTPWKRIAGVDSTTNNAQHYLFDAATGKLQINLHKARAPAQTAAAVPMGDSVRIDLRVSKLADAPVRFSTFDTLGRFQPGASSGPALAIGETGVTTGLFSEDITFRRGSSTTPFSSDPTTNTIFLQDGASVEFRAVDTNFYRMGDRKVFDKGNPSINGAGCSAAVGSPGDMLEFCRMGTNHLVQATAKTVWTETTNAQVAVYSDNFGIQTAKKDVYGGQAVTVRVTDGDRNTDPSKAETLEVTLTSSNGASVTQTLRETGANTGVFESKVVLRDTVAPTHGGTYDVTYADTTSATGSSATRRLLTDDMPGTTQKVSSAKWFRSERGSIEIAESVVSTTSSLVVRVRDNDQNGDPFQRDEIAAFASGAPLQVFLASADHGLLPTDPVTTVETLPSALTLRETSVDSNVFEGMLDIALLGLGPIDADHYLRFVYEDPRTHNGLSGQSVHAVTVVPQSTGLPTVPASTFTSRTQLVTVTVADAPDGTPGTQKVDVVYKDYDKKCTTSGAGANCRTFPLTESGSGTGIYRTTFGLQSSDSDGIQDVPVDNDKPFYVVYTDEKAFTAQAPRTSLQRMVLQSIDVALTTEVAVTPATPDGKSGCATGAGKTCFGWYKSPVTVQLSVPTDKQQILQRFEYKFGSEGTVSTCVSGCSFQVTNEGENKVFVRSITTGGFEEEWQEILVKVDGTAPTATVSGLTATLKPNGGVQLDWSASVAKDDPTEFGSYVVYRDSLTGEPVSTAAIATETFTDTPGDEESHTWYVVIEDAAGNKDLSNVPDAAKVTARPDKTVPVLDAATVTPTELFEEEGDTTVTITATVATDSLTDTQKVIVRAVDPFGRVSTEFELARQGTSAIWSGSFAQFNLSGIWKITVAAVDLAGNEGKITTDVRYFGVDDAPPVVEVPSTVKKGDPLKVTVKENDAGIATVSYRLDGAAAVTVTVTGKPLEHIFDIATSGLSIGEHTLVITVADAYTTPNAQTYTFTFEVTGSDGTTPPPVGTKPVIEQVSSLVDNGGQFRFKVSANALTALTVSFDGGTSQAILSSWTNAATPVSVSVGSLAAGEHTATVVAVSTGGTTTAEFTFYVLDSGIPLPPETVVVTETKDGKPKIQWTASPSTNLGGYLVHRAASPSEVIAVVGPDVTEFVDETAKDGKTYSYAVTAYGSNGEGKLAKGDASEDLSWFGHVKASTYKVKTGEPGILGYWWLVLVLAVVIGAVAMAYVYRERLFGRRDEDEAYQAEYPDEVGASPFAVERHHMRCPNCTHEFSVSGQKPIVTTCPNCGKKGILR